MIPPNSFIHTQGTIQAVDIGTGVLRVHSRVIEKLTASTRKWNLAILSRLSDLKLRGAERLELLTATGARGATERLLASNIQLRRTAIFILADQLFRLRERSVHIPGRRFWHASFLGPLVSEYTPQIDIDAYRHSVYSLLRKEGFHALFAIELQALTNYPQRGRGRSFLMNAHAVCWSDDRALDADVAVVQMRESGLLFSGLGAETVTMTPRTLDPGEIEYLAYYLLKPPLDGKRRCRDENNSSRWILKPVANVRTDLLLRLNELLSHLEYSDLVWGVGDGSKFRLALKQQLVAWNSVRCARQAQPLESSFDMTGLWSRIRGRGNGSPLYLPPKFFGPLPRRVLTQTDSEGARIRPSRPKATTI